MTASYVGIAAICENSQWFFVCSVFQKNTSNLYIEMTSELTGFLITFTMNVYETGSIHTTSAVFVASVSAECTPSRFTCRLCSGVYPAVHFARYKFN